MYELTATTLPTTIAISVNIMANNGLVKVRTPKDIIAAALKTPIIKKRLCFSVALLNLPAKLSVEITCRGVRDGRENVRAARYGYSRPRALVPCSRTHHQPRVTVHEKSFERVY